jgi:hypothetical protein
MDSRLSRWKSVLFALAVPPLLGVVFIPLFRTMQQEYGPVGNLEGRDLTPYAQRDELVFTLFVVVLFLFAIFIAWRAPHGLRAVTSIAAFVAAIATAFGVFFGLMAP